MIVEFPNIRHLIALVELRRTRRIALAAGRVHLSQPAVTQAIARIEKSLGTLLFDRRPDGMFATGIGERFGVRVERVLEYLRAGEAQALRRGARQGQARRAGFHRLVTAVQLRSLVAVADAGSFSQAARHLGVSQPAVQRAARDLETLSGLDLFEPIRRGIALTPAAEALALNVRLAAAEYRQGLYEVGEYLGRDSTAIAIGSMPLSRTALLPAAIDDLLREAPGRVQVRCVDGPYETLARDLRHGDLDFLIGALRDPPPSDDIEQEELFSDDLAVVARVGHPLADHPEPGLGDTLGYPWIAPPRPTPSGSYLFEKLGIPGLPDTPVRIVSSSLVLVRGLMMRGDYLTVMSRRQIEVEERLGVLTALPIPLPDSRRPIGLSFRRGWVATRSQRRMLDLIRARASAARDL
jgi:DNA-binding transcriptional LysR family regulator